MNPAAPADSLFTREGGLVIPTVLTEGPWDPRAMHGGPPAGLLAHAVEGFDANDGSVADDWFVSRLTIELLRPLPLEPLQVRSALNRPGRKLQLVDASLWSADGAKELARVCGLRVRRQPDLAIPATSLQAHHENDQQHRPSGADAPDRAPRGMSWGEGRGFYNLGADVRLSKGAPGSGVGVMWARMRVPLFANELTSPLVRTATLADFTNAAASVLPMGQWTYPNADLTVHRFRAMEGEWLGIAATSRVSEGGIGLINAELHDTTGPIGLSAGCLVVSSSRPT